MLQKLHIGTSPLNGTIHIGYLLKDGRTWANNKTDVTIDALVAVIEHALLFKERSGENIIVSEINGNKVYEIAVKRLSE